VDLSNLQSGQNVDNTILRIGRTYDDLGRVETVASYSDTSGTTAVNQVKYEYNGWGEVSREYQEHDGAVDAATLFVQYDYDDGASGGVAKYVRLSQVTYPNGREVHYGYGTTGAIDDIMSRLATLGDGTNTHASYTYLGAGRIVTEDYEDIDVKLDYSANDFAAIDRFARVLDQVWTDYGADPDVVLDHYSYTYDRAGSRTARDNELHSAFDEEYLYDDLDRLTDADRADAFDQSWGLDGLGNFSTFNDDGASQTRTVNGANEITAITGGWISPTYDRAGNMISAPKPGDETARVHYVYDAWNHLVKVYADDSQNPGTPGDLIAEYKYDGTNRRIEKEITEEGGGPTHVHYFYNHDWQMLEERFVDGEGDTVASNQYVWSARYIDAPVLRFHDGNGDGDCNLATDAADTIRYYAGDANYNVTTTITIGQTETVTEHCVYTAYGEATVYDAAWVTLGAPAEDGPLYCGYFFDAETGNDLARNRYYNVALATWISRDPIGYKGKDVNLYRYVRNSPLNRLDPLGLKIICCGGETLTAIRLLGIGNAWTANRLANEALEEARRVAPTLPGGLGGLHNGAADAFRHCYWSCRMAEEMGASYALTAGNIHEDCASNQPPGEEAMDRANNSIGVQLARRHNCSDDCADFARDGTLQTSPGGNPPGGYLGY